VAEKAALILDPAGQLGRVAGLFGVYRTGDRPEGGRCRDARTEACCETSAEIAPAAPLEALEMMPRSPR